MRNYEEIITSLLVTGSVSTFWGTAYYFYQVSKWKPFKLTMFCIHIFLAWFVWYIVDQFLPVWMNARWGYIWIAWFLSYIILEQAEKKWLDIIINKIKWEK